MKQFENKLTEIPTPVDPVNDPQGETKKATYASLIFGALKGFSLEGFSYDDIKKRFRIIDVMEPLEDKPKGKCQLEDADASYLFKILKDYRWRIVHKELVELIDYVANLKTAK